MAGPPSTCDVLVVGAGPSGLAAGCALAQADSSVVVVDARVAPATESRAAVLHARTLEALEGIGATEELLRRGQPVTRFAVRRGARRLGGIDFGVLAGRTRFPIALMLGQEHTEAALARVLQETGGTAHRGWRLVGLDARAERVDARLEDEAGRARSVRARYVVGADGSRSAVRALSGLGFDGGAYDSDLVLADVRMRWPLGHDEVQLLVAPGGMTVVAPLPDADRYRVVAMLPDPPADPTTDDVQRLLDDRGPAGTVVEQVLWGSRFRVEHRRATAVRAGRVLLVGDAAHVHSPAGGQGMNLGIRDAITLAAPLTRALDPGGDTDALGAWADVRQRRAAAVVSRTDRMTRAAALRSPVGRAARDAVLSAVLGIPAARARLAAGLAGLDDVPGA